MPSKKKSSKVQSKGGPKAPRAKPRGGTGPSEQKLVSLPASVAVTTRNRGGGMGDIRGHRMRWRAGYLVTGNTSGSLGVNGDVYFSSTAVPSATIYKGAIPVDGPDAVFGQTYIADVMKHYARKRIGAVRCMIRPFGIGISTNTGINYTVAPVRGNELGYGAVTTAAAGTPVGSTAGMADSVEAASWVSSDIDLTRYCVNPSGTREFVIYRDNTSQTDLQSLAVGCSLVVSGNNAGSGVDGKAFASVDFEWVCDLLDFVGGNTATYPGRPAPGARPAISGGATDCPGGDSKSPPATGPLSKDSEPVCSAGPEWELVEALDPATGFLQPRYRNRSTGALANSVDLPKPRLMRQ